MTPEMEKKTNWKYLCGVTARPHCERVYVSPDYPEIEMVILTSWKGEGYKPGKSRTYFYKGKKRFKTLEGALNGKEN